MDLEYYDYSEIDKTGCNYRIIIGERSNGKTYGFKKKAIENFFENGKQFAYVRRMVEEIKLKRVSQYFADMDDVLKIYRNKYYPQYDYLTIKAARGRFDLFGVTVETGVSDFLGTMGFYFALAQTNYDKTVPYPNVNMLCWDEFLTNGIEYPNELSLLANLISTIKRKREHFIIYLLGNTVTRNSQVLCGMGINVRKLEPGKIACYSYESKDDPGVINTVAIEYCRHYAQSEKSESFFIFNSPREMMITDGAFEVDEYPKFDQQNIDFDQKPLLSLFLRFGDIKLYSYLLENELIVSGYRLPFRQKMYMLGDCQTRIDRNQFSLQGANKFSEKITRVLLAYLSNGLIRFDCNYTGDDFSNFLRQIKNSPL